MCGLCGLFLYIWMGNRVGARVLNLHQAGRLYRWRASLKIYNHVSEGLNGGIQSIRYGVAFLALLSLLVTPSPFSFNYEFEQVKIDENEKSEKETGLI